MTKVRVAVIGVGSMGRNHARIYRELPSTDLVAVADMDANVAQMVGSQYGTKWYANYQQMLEREKPEAVTIAVPTADHYVAAMDALQAGCHVLIEKPITSDLESAANLIEEFKQAGRVLAVGHVERFNPAVIELKHRMSDGQCGQVFQIHTRRLGPFPPRVRDVGVVVDLAVHDLDMMRYLLESEPCQIYAESRREIHDSHEDLVVGMLSFENGVLGLLEINWLTPTKVRELYVTAERCMYVVNYLTQDLMFFENSVINDSGWNSLNVLRGVNEGAMTRFALKKREPLRAEQEAFIDAVRGNHSQIVTGYDGLAALRLAYEMLKSSQSHSVCNVQK